MKEDAKMSAKKPQNIKRTVDIDPIWQRFANSASGHFQALVRLSGDYRPDYMKIGESFTPGVMKAELPAGALARLASDERVLSVELREFIGA